VNIPDDARLEIAAGCFDTALEHQMAIGYAVKLFIDPQRPYGEDLHRCQWDDCQRFFLTSVAQQLKKKATGEKGGLPRTKFCSDRK